MDNIKPLTIEEVEATVNNPDLWEELSVYFSDYGKTWGIYPYTPHAPENDKPANPKWELLRKREEYLFRVINTSTR